MADTRTLDSALVRSALRTRSQGLRAAATLAVGQVHGSAMVGELRSLLLDPDTAVAANAAYAIGLLRDSASVDALARALSGNAVVAREAAWALGAIGAPAAAGIRGALAEGASAPGAYGALLLAAAKLRPVPIAEVQRYLQHPDSAIRWKAAYAIARPLVPGGVRLLAAIKADPAGSVRAQVARGLSKAAAGDSLRDIGLGALQFLMHDLDPHVRVNAVRSLGTYGLVASSLLMECLNDHDANVRIAVAQSLGTSLDSVTPFWTAAWNADTGFTFRRGVLASAMHAGVTRMSLLAGSAAWAESDDWRFRAAMAEAIGGAKNSDRAIGIAVPLTRDPDARVRVAAYAALVPGDSLAPTSRREVLLSGLHDRDPFVRQTATTGLARRASAAELPAILDSYTRYSASDDAHDARLAVVRYVAAAWKRDSAAFTPALRAALRQMRVPPEPFVRAAAKDVAPLAHWSVGTPAGRSLDWYQQRVRSLVLPALEGRLSRTSIVTQRGTVVFELLAAEAPLTVDNFIGLAQNGYYNRGNFHRVVPNFVAQDGDPRGDGNGGPPYSIRDELNRLRHERGAVGMALSGPDTGGSQYFLTLSPQPHLDGGYTVFGRVVSGFDVMDALVQGDRIITIRIQ